MVVERAGSSLCLKYTPARRREYAASFLQGLEVLTWHDYEGPFCVLGGLLLLPRSELGWIVGALEYHHHSHQRLYVQEPSVTQHYS